MILFLTCFMLLSDQWCKEISRTSSNHICSGGTSVAALYLNWNGWEAGWQRERFDLDGNAHNFTKSKRDR
jgi:hypothetical protein